MMLNLKKLNLFICAIFLWNTAVDAKWEVISKLYVIQSKYVYQSDVQRWIGQNKIIVTWEQAKQNCNRAGAILASPINEQLLKYMKSYIAVNGHRNSYFIGMKATLGPELRYVSVEGIQLDDMPDAVIDMIEQLDPLDGYCLSMNHNNIRAEPCWHRLPYICYTNKTTNGTMTGKPIDVVNTTIAVTTQHTTPIPDVSQATIKPTNYAELTSTTQRATTYKEITSATSCNTTGYTDVTQATPNTTTGYVEVSSTTPRPTTGYAGVISTTPRPTTGYAELTPTTPRPTTGYGEVNSTTTHTTTEPTIVTLTTPHTTVGHSEVTITTPHATTKYSEINSTTSQTTMGYGEVNSTISRAPTEYTVVTSTTPHAMTEYAEVTSTTSRATTGYADVTLSTPRTTTGYVEVTPTTSRTTTGYTMETSKTSRAPTEVTPTTPRTTTTYIEVALTTPNITTGYVVMTPTTPRVTLVTTAATPTTPRGSTGYTEVTSTTLLATSEFVVVTSTTPRATTGYTEVTSTTPRVPNCDYEGYKYYPQTDSCYKVYFIREKWINAKAACENEGGYLVVLNNAYVAKIIQQILRDVYVQKAWTGLQDETGQGNWRSVQGHSLNEIYQQNRFQHVRNKGRCAAIHATNGVLYEFYCTEAMNFICERDIIYYNQWSQ